MRLLAWNLLIFLILTTSFAISYSHTLTPNSSKALIRDSVNLDTNSLTRHKLRIIKRNSKAITGNHMPKINPDSQKKWIGDFNKYAAKADSGLNIISLREVRNSDDVDYAIEHGAKFNSNDVDGNVLIVDSFTREHELRNKILVWVIAIVCCIT
jgi:hypothetical protein